MNPWIFAFTWVFSAAIGGGLIVLAIEAVVARHRRRKLIAAGIYPRPGTESDEDVQRLLLSGHEDMAVRCYQKVHRGSYQHAKERLGLVKHSAHYGFPFFGFVLGLSLGMIFKKTTLGVALGIILGTVLEIVARRIRASK